MQPFERDRQELSIIQKSKKAAVTLLKMLTEKHCRPKSVLTKTGIFFLCLQRRS